MRAVVQRLPATHLTVLRFLIEHLSRMTEHAAVTKMDATNLAIVFGPTLLRCAVESMETVMNIGNQNKAVETMIRAREVVFS